MTEGIATPGGGWRRAQGPVGPAGASATRKGGGRRGGGRGGEMPMVEDAEFASYYGRPIIKAPVWKTPDVPLYLFLGGRGRRRRRCWARWPTLTGRPALTRDGAAAWPAAARSRSVGFLIHDLGRPERFLHMLRVFKPTSPLSVGSYILSPFSAAAGATAAVELLGWFPRLQAVRRRGRRRCSAAPMTTYTAVLLSNTAVPSWHELHGSCRSCSPGRRMAAGGGMCMALAPVAESEPAREDGDRRGGDRAGRDAGRSSATQSIVAEPYHEGRAGTLMKAAKACTASGLGAGRARRAQAAGAGSLSGALLAAGLAAHPVRRVRRRRGQRQGPEVHRRPAAGAHGGPRRIGPFGHPVRLRCRRPRAGRRRRAAHPARGRK